MKELSLNILDIANNSVKAGATLLEITVIQQEGRMTVSVKDDGCGMSAEQVSRLSDPFYTTRTTRKVGLGIPFLKLAAEQAGGGVTVTSVPAGGDGPPRHHRDGVLRYEQHRLHAAGGYCGDGRHADTRQSRYGSCFLPYR